MTRLDINNLYLIPLKYQVMALFFVVFIASLMSIVFFSYRYHALSGSLDSEMNVLYQQYKKAYEERILFENEVKYFEKIKDKKTFFNNLLITESTYPDVLNEILQNGKKRELSFPSVEKDKLKMPEEGYTHIKLLMHAVGSYDNIALFLVDTANLQQVVGVDSIEIPDTTSSKSDRFVKVVNARSGEMGVGSSHITHDNVVTSLITINLYEKQDEPSKS